MSESVLVGKIIALSLDTMTCTVNTADRDMLCELPFGGEVVVVRMNDWLQNTIALRSATSHIVALEVNLQSARADIERIGHERDQMVAANVELQERANETHDALRRMAQSWLTLAASYDVSPRHQGEADTLKRCVYELSHMWDAANHPIEPEEDK